MKLSQTVGHALAATVYIARSGPGVSHNNRDICNSVGLPRPFVLQLLGLLTERGILASTRGRYGGYALARPASEINLLDIIVAVDGPIEESTELHVKELRSEAVALIIEPRKAASLDAKRRLSVR